MEPSWHQKSIKHHFFAARIDSKTPRRSWRLPEAAKSSKNKFSVRFKEPEEGGSQTTGVTARAMSTPLKHFFQRKPTRTRVLSSGHRTHGPSATPSRQARWRIRRPTGDERARFGLQILSKVSVQSLCPKSLSKVSVNPLQVLPRRALSASAAHLGPGFGLLTRLLVEKVAFQNVFQQISKKRVLHKENL